MTNSSITLGIIGGGQLGRMICFYAHMLGLKTVIFTDKQNSPASFVSNQVIVGDYSDKKLLETFCNLVDLATFEFENIPFETAEFIEQKVGLFPNSNILKITQNRILEKEFLRKIGVRTATYKEILSIEDVEEFFNKYKKIVIKTALMGYDGKGQFTVNNLESAKDIFNQNQTQKLIAERFCKFDSEASVLVARSRKGEIKTYEPISNFHKNGILDRSFYPAKISQNHKNLTQGIAKKIAEELGLVGIMAVEFFIIGNDIFVNELAPRPHNSGHLTMNAAKTSQFEQLIRAILGYKLGNADFHSKCEMVNLIGDDVNDLEKFYKNSNAKIHLYDKSEVKEGRKMGHVNLLK